MGFRRVLRSTFPHLRIVERVISDEIPETTYEQLSSFFETKGLPSAIYNVAGANRGIAQALEESEAAESTIFVGHELTPVSQGLLESGTMDYVISHDFNAELRAAVQWIDAFPQRRRRRFRAPRRYSCTRATTAALNDRLKIRHRSPTLSLPH